MKIRVIAVGKLKEKYLKEGIAEYSKRLQGYCDFEIVEVSDERIPRRPTLAEEALIKAKEGRRILDHVKERDYMILLDVSSKQMDSLHFACELHDIMLSGYSTSPTSFSVLFLLNKFIVLLRSTTMKLITNKKLSLRDSFLCIYSTLSLRASMTRSCKYLSIYS